MKSKIYEIIRREYIERIRKKSFWIATVLMPLMFLALIILPVLLGQMNLKKQIRIVVIDQSGKAFAAFRNNIIGHEHKKKSTTAQKDQEPDQYIIEQVAASENVTDTISQLKIKIADDKLEGCLLIGPNYDDPKNFQYFGRSVSNIEMMQDLSAALTPIVVADRLQRNKIFATLEQIKEWTQHVDLETFQVQQGGTTKKSSFGSAYFTAFIFIFILYILWFIYGIANMRGVLEEKTTRIMEVLLSTFNTRQVLTGKLLGIGLVGFTQILVYALSAGILVVYVAFSAMSFSPAITEAVKSFNPISLVYFIVFYLLGYFIFSSMFLCVGSLCSTEEDAQNMQTPVMMMIVVPFMFTFFFITNPDSMPAVIVSLIPIFTPMIMMMRILVLTPPLWQILLSILLCILFLVFILWVVAKIFRIAALSYGKRPTLKEVFQWVRLS